MAQLLITPEAFLAHWQGHRRLTRRVIEAFPEDKLFTYSIGGMRPFADLALEMIHMARPGMQGFVSRRWEDIDSLGHHRAGAAKPATRAALLEFWDDTTRVIDTLWPQIPEGRFQETDKLFNAYEGTIYGGVLYLVDNEVHHRAQGYVYLRSLGVEPPPFWDRY